MEFEIVDGAVDAVDAADAVNAADAVTADQNCYSMGRGRFLLRRRRRKWSLS
jgi:hypothetical protein